MYRPSSSFKSGGGGGGMYTLPSPRIYASAMGILLLKPSWLEQDFLRENNHSLLEIFMSPSLLLVAYILFLVIYCYIMFALIYTFLYIDDVKKRVLAKPQRSVSEYICRASERALELVLKKGQFLYNKCQILSYLIFKKWGGGIFVQAIPHPPGIYANVLCRPPPPPPPPFHANGNGPVRHSGVG